MNKQEFTNKYCPGNYTDEEFGELANQFEIDLDDLLQLYADEQSREILTILKGAKREYNGGHHKEETNAAFKGGIQTAINCVEAYIEKGMDFQNAANYNSGLKEQEGE